MSVIVQVNFDKFVFTKEAARTWLKNHNMKAKGYLQTQTSHRFFIRSSKMYEKFEVLNYSPVQYIAGVKTKKNKHLKKPKKKRYRRKSS